MGEVDKIRMGLSETEVLGLARDLLDEKAFEKLRKFIWTNHIICSTESSRQALERLWDASVYREFALNRGIDLETSLPTAMKFKLKSKYPFPAEHQGDEDEMEDEAEEPRASGNNNNNSNKKEVKNARLPRSVHEGLNAWLKKHQDHPFPNKEEKEMLSSTLGITPQQVNRWFIQRRKMLRIRGKLYLGRGFANEEVDDDDELDDNCSVKSNDNHQGTYPFAAHFLFNPHSSTLQRQDMMTPPMDHDSSLKYETSGGSVEVMDEILHRSSTPRRQQRLQQQQQQQQPMITPPASVYGGEGDLVVDLSSNDDEEALDLTKSCHEEDDEFNGKLVILEERKNNFTDLERIAVHALLTMSGREF